MPDKLTDNEKGLYLIIAGIALTGLVIWQRKRISYYLRYPFKALIDYQNQQKLKTLNPKAKFIISSFLSKVKLLGYGYEITSAHRTLSQQNRLREYSTLAVQNSSHLYGMAADVVFYKDGKRYGLAQPKQEWENTGIPDLADKAGLNWGGDFSAYDPVHFDAVPVGVDRKSYLSSLQKQAEVEFGNEWGDKGNQLKIS